MSRKFLVDLDMNDLDILNALTSLVIVDDSVLATDKIKVAIGKLQGQIDVWNELVTLNQYTNSSSSALQNITELGFDVVAGRKYRLEVTMRFQSAAANRGLAVTIGTSNTAAGSITATANFMAGNDGSSGLYSGAITSLGDIVVASTVQAASTDYICRVEGIFVCTASGTIYPQFRSSNNGNNIIVGVGSCNLVRDFA